MTASTEASSDSDTDVDGEAVVDHLPHDDATDDTAPGQDAGVGPASLAFTSFLLAMLCLSPFYMLGSNLWDLMNGRGLLLEFSDLTSQTQRLPFKHATVQMISGYSTTYGSVEGLSGASRFFIGLFHQHPPHPHRGLRSRLRPVHRRDPSGPPGIRRPALHPGRASVLAAPGPGSELSHAARGRFGDLLRLPHPRQSPRAVAKRVHPHRQRHPRSSRASSSSSSPRTYCSPCTACTSAPAPWPQRTPCCAKRPRGSCEPRRLPPR